MAGQRNRDPAWSAPLVGRAHELSALAAALARPPAVATVAGEAGVGKTRLVAELRVQAPHRFVTGYCHAIREPFPLGPVLEAARGLADAVVPERLSAVAGVLRPLLPELATRLPAAPEPLADRAGQRHRIFRALAELLDSAGPVTVVLEDLHWADEQTGHFLRYLLDGMPRQLSLLATFRDDEVGPGVRAQLSRSPEPLTGAHVDLAPLDVAETGRLAAAIVDVERMSEDFVVYLRERTGGLPFAIEEVMALLRERGVVARHGQRWVPRTLDELAVPAAVRDHVLARASLLPAQARPVLEAAAVVSTPAAEPLVASVARQSPEEVTAGLSQAVQAGLLVEKDGGGAVGFRHRLAAQAIYDSIPAPRRRELHSRCAAALSGADPPALGQLAHHLRGAGESAAWVDAVDRAAGEATRYGHDDEAARLLEDVLRQAPLTGEQRWRYAVRLGYATGQALHPSREAADLLAQVLDGHCAEPVAAPMPPAVRGELRFLLGMVLDQMGGDPGRPCQLFRDAVEDLAPRPDLQAWAMVAVGMRTSPGREGRQWLDRALGVIPAVTDPVFEVFLLGKVTAMLVHTGDLRWYELLARIEQRTGGAATQRRQVNAFQAVGQTACYAGHHEAADRLLAVALAGAVALEDKRLEAFTRSARTVLDYCRSAWDGLDQRAAGLIERLADQPRARSMVEVVAACVALARGDSEGATSRLHRIVTELAGEGASDVLPMAVGGLIRGTLAQGEVAAASAAAHGYLAGQEAGPLPPASTRALPWVAEALVAGGEITELRSLVSGWTEALAGQDAPLAAAALAHAAGLADLADGPPDAAASRLEAAAGGYEALACHYEAAHARERAAQAHLAGGRQASADQQLRACLAGYERLAAATDLARAARTARRHGVPVPAAHRLGRRGYGAELSPRERRVAELATRGRTNQEIADELFVSANTVKKQLAAAMRKLDVSSRTALVRRLSGDLE